MAVIYEITPEEHAAGIQSAVVRGGYVVKPHVQRFADALEEELGYTLSFGTYAGHSPPEGPTQAIDVFNTDTKSGYAQQDQVCAFAIANQKKYGVRYCIRRHEIWNIERAVEGWRDQGVQGNRTADHYDHTHITFYATAEDVPDIPKPKPVPTKKETDLFIYDGPKGIGGVWFTDMYSKWGVPNEDSLVVYQRGFVEHLGQVSRDFHFGLRLRNDGVADNPGVG